MNGTEAKGTCAVDKVPPDSGPPAAIGGPPDGVVPVVLGVAARPLV